MLKMRITSAKYLRINLQQMTSPERDGQKKVNTNNIQDKEKKVKKILIIVYMK